MNTIIEIIDNNTNETGTVKVWFHLYDANNAYVCVTLSESVADSMLSLRQKEMAVSGQYKFRVSAWDIKELSLKYSNSSYKCLIEKYIK